MSPRIKNNLVLARSATAVYTLLALQQSLQPNGWVSCHPVRARVTKGTHCHVNNLVLTKSLCGKGNIIQQAERKCLLFPPEVMGWRSNYTGTRLFLENTDANVPSSNVCTMGDLGKQAPSKQA